MVVKVKEEMVSVMIPSTLKERLDFYSFHKGIKVKRETPEAPKVTLKSVIIEAFTEYLDKYAPTVDTNEKRSTQ